MISFVKRWRRFGERKALRPKIQAEIAVYGTLRATDCEAIFRDSIWI